MLTPVFAKRAILSRKSDESIFHLRGVWFCLSFVLVNCADPDQMPCSVPSGLDLHFL